eukprot:414594_1
METIDVKSKYHQKLLDCVDKATSIADVQSVLNFIGIDALKPIIQNQIGLLNTRDAQKAFYETQSITEILNDDVLQHMLSFDMHPNSQLVCKKWDKQIHSAKIAFERQRHRIVQQYFQQHSFAPVVSHKDTMNITWVVHPTRDRLTENEIASGYKGPMNCFFAALESYDSGDILLVHPGEYQYTRTHQWQNDPHQPYDVVLDKDIQIIGVGSKANTVINMELMSGTMRSGIMCSGNANIYLRNVTIVSNSHPCGLVIGGATVWMENCCYFHWGDHRNHISVQEGSTLNLKNCLLVRFIIMAERAKVTSIGCTFGYSSKLLHTIMGRSAIRVHPGPGFVGILVEAAREEKDQSVKNGELMCIGNVFVDLGNNQKYPTSSIADQLENLKVVLIHNILVKNEQGQCIIAGANETAWQNDTMFEKR